jgi:hypothetical protein
VLDFAEPITEGDTVKEALTNARTLVAIIDAYEDLERPLSTGFARN